MTGEVYRMMACPNHQMVTLREVTPAWTGQAPSTCSECGMEDGPCRCLDCGALIEARVDERGHTIIVLLDDHAS